MIKFNIDDSVYWPVMKDKLEYCYIKTGTIKFISLHENCVKYHINAGYSNVPEMIELEENSIFKTRPEAEDEIKRRVDLILLLADNFKGIK